MAEKIYGGYSGIATVDGKVIRISSCNIAAKQDVLFYTHTIGLNDSGFSGSKTKGESIGTVQPQKMIARPSQVAISGSISFPVFEGFQSIFDNVRKGNFFDIDVQYHCGRSRSFKNCRCNGMDFSIVSGEYANASIDVLAMEVVDGASSVTYNDSQKLLTWDQISANISGDGIDLDVIHGVNFKINNAANYIYTAKAATNGILSPYAIRLGTQEVTGSISGYIGKGHEYVKTSATAGSVNISSSWLNANMSVMFKSDTVESQVGPVIVTVPFIGIDKVFN